MSDAPRKLSLVIPAHNEDGVIRKTVEAFHSELEDAGIDHEILVVNDNSSDGTVAILDDLCSRYPDSVRYINNRPPNGFGFAVRAGLDDFTGDAVAIVMADLSDRPIDLVAYWEKLQEGYDCVFGNRFCAGAKVVDYPKHKLWLNRFTNHLIRMMFRTGYSDTTNAFKLYRRETIDGLKPFMSHHFNLTVELPLKAMVRGYTFAVVPNWWINREVGESKLQIKEMGSRYFFIILYCLLEKWLSRGDYHKRMAHSRPLPRIAQASKADDSANRES